MENKVMQKQNIGNAGEYYLAARLSAQNFIVTITLGRAEKYDILAVNSNGKTFKISVKSRYSTNATGFPLSYKDEQGGSDDFYYAFIKLNEFKSEPEFWIIPSKRVNKIVYDAEIKWCKPRGINSENRKGIRKFWTEINETKKSFYPLNWKEELETYSKNIEQLTK